MTIEVRQMVIKSTVLQESRIENNESDSSQHMEETKRDILAECRQLILEMFAEKQER